MSGQSTGRVVLVNGASGGLGPAVVRGFAREGARLILTGMTTEQVEQTARQLELDPANTLAVGVNLTQAEDVTGLVKSALDRFGAIDVVAHVTGGFKMGQVAETDMKTWSFMLDLNLTAAFLTAN